MRPGGGIADIHYVADWDGKDRSNDEEEPTRSQWIDKATGKVINLSNFGYAGMSGWNGYAEDYMTWLNYTNRGEYVITGAKITVKSIKQPIGPSSGMVMTERRNAVSYDIPSYRIRVSGLPSGARLVYTYQPVSEENVLRVQITSANGVYTVPEIPAGSQFVGFRIDMAEIFEEITLQTPLVIEQLPLYPGALVSDGVDDYGRTTEVIDEQVGTLAVVYAMISTHAGWQYLLDSASASDPDNSRIYMGFTQSSSQIRRFPIEKGFTPTGSTFELQEMIYAFASRQPKATGAPFTLFNFNLDSSFQCTNAALYRLILIKEQLSGQQIEFLKWKVEKEYRDWCKANGYEYAIDEMLNN